MSKVVVVFKGVAKSSYIQEEVKSHGVTFNEKDLKIAKNKCRKYKIWGREGFLKK